MSRRSRRTWQWRMGARLVIWAILTAAAATGAWAVTLVIAGGYAGTAGLWDWLTDRALRQQGVSWGG